MSISLAGWLLSLALTVPQTQPESLPADTPEAPRWVRMYTEGLQAWREIIYYWLDRQRPDGTFGFGWGDDCEMVVGWPGVMMAADDSRIEQGLERLIDNNWYNDSIQNGYVWLATDAEHGPEPISYGSPIMLYQRFGSPKFIERLMITAKNVEQWTGITPKGDRHMRSTYFGSQQMYDWPFYDEDCPINARAWLPMAHLLLYNRDPHLMPYFLEWTGAWAKHAMVDTHGKPPGFIPGQVAFKTGEVGEYTDNWWGAGAHEFSSLWYQTRMNEMLVVAYVLTGEDRYIAPLREVLRFFADYARPPTEPGQTPAPDRLPRQYTFPPGWRDGVQSTRWARDAFWGHIGNWYYYVTGDTQFDEAYARLFNEKVERGPFDRVDMRIVEQGARRAISFRDNYFQKTLKQIDQRSSISNYLAAWWQKQYGSMTFGQRCFRDGGRLSNSVNWPWVDFPPPAVVWKNTGYTTGIFVLEDSPTRFSAALANLATAERRIGAQLFTLDAGEYTLRLGPDSDEDGRFDAVTRTDRLPISRGTIVWLDLPPNVTILFELKRSSDSPSAPSWQAKADLGLDAWDIMVSKEQPAPGEPITVNVRVHNIGSAVAEQVVVDLRGDNDTILGTATLDRINPPMELIPSHVDVPINWTVQPGITRLTAILDGPNNIHELFEGNNTATIELAKAHSAQPVKKVITHAPATRPSLGDVKTDQVTRYDVAFRRNIQVDGLLGENEWLEVPVFQLIPHNSKIALRKKSWMQVAYDQRALYLGLRCEEPDLYLLKTDLPRVEDIYYNDGFEIFLDPQAQVWRYWQFCFDTVGHKFQTLTRNQYARQVEWEVAVRKGPAEWTAEVCFPFDQFDVPAPTPGGRWRINVMRYTTTIPDPDKPGKHTSERSHFSPKGSLHGHHQADLFGDLHFQAPSAEE